MSEFSTRLSRTQDQWALRVVTPAGEKLLYRYSSEREARYFAAIFALGPTYVPDAPPAPRPRRRAGKRAATGSRMTGA